MPLVITDEEASAIRTALDNYLPTLRFEAARVKQSSERHELVVLEELLTGLHRRLSESQYEPAEQRH